MKKLFILFLAGCGFTASAQSNRVTDHNNINWLQSFVTIKLNKNFDWLAEAQWRRTEGLSVPQQLLLRTAIQYKINNQVSLATGYAWANTYAYGDYPIAANGTFPERRIFQQVVLKQPVQKLSVSHRLRTEQRWIGRISANTPGKVEDWVFSNRFRYQVRLQRQFTDSGKVPFYGALANEIFINAGKNVGVNIFDQNRLQGFIGIKLNSVIGLEAGYIKQTLQQGRRTSTGSTVIQNNDGATLALLIQL